MNLVLGVMSSGHWRTTHMLNNALHAAMCHLNQSDTCKIMKAIEKGGDVQEAGRCIFFTRYAVPWVKGRVKAYLTGKLRSGPR